MLYAKNSKQKLNVYRTWLFLVTTRVLFTLFTQLVFFQGP